MDVLYLISLFFTLLVVGWFVLSFYQIISAILKYFFKDYFNRYLLLRKLKPAYKSVLETRFTYYKKLNAQDKKLFERRVQKFIGMKKFVARGELIEITAEMKALVAASAIQITFGLPSVYFSHFWRILLYPDNYYSTITQMYHQGEVNSRGLIVLSWKSFLSGYLDERDGRNLGLHEMAHALKISDTLRNEDYNFFDTNLLNHFVLHGRAEMERIINGEESLFRDYASTNDHEFFAIAIENFFERPEAFDSINPVLYQALCELLQQNPLTYK